MCAGKRGAEFLSLRQSIRIRRVSYVFVSTKQAKVEKSDFRHLWAVALGGGDL